MKKKSFALFLALILIFSMSACSSSSGEVRKPSNVKADGNEPASVDSNEEDDLDSEEVSIEETVLLDESGIKITAKSLSMNEIFGPELKMLIENDSGKDLTVQCRNSSVNGYMVDTMMSVDIVNGKKANDTLTFMGSDLETCGIDAIADMEFSFHIFTTDGWDTYLDTDQIQLQTYIADTYEYVFDDSGDVAYSNDGMKVVVKGLAEDASIFGPSIVIYVENNRNDGFTVQGRDISINGFMVDAIFSCDVMPGKKAVDTITFMSSDLEENDITSVEDVELSFHIFETAGWETIVDTDPVTIAF